MNNEVLIHNFTELVSTLQQLGAPIGADARQQVFQAHVMVPPLDTMLFARWEITLPYLHLLMPVVVGFPDARLSAMESAVCHANNRIVLAGFGLDYGRRAVTFKVTLPVSDGIVSSTLTHVLQTMTNYARDFFVPFGKVAEGTAGPETIIETYESWVAVDRASRNPPA